MTNQAVEQQRELNYTGKRTLDFSPFEQALGAFSEEQAAQVAEILRESTIPDIQRAFESRTLNSEELVLYYLTRIRQFDLGRLNSVLELNSDALTLARRCDTERRERRGIGPLHGIPIGLKDNIGTGDAMHNTAGAKALEDARSGRDSFIARKLREAGAILLMKTNLSEWANYMTSKSLNGFSVLGGQTHNPYGPFDVGGSSSGSAVSVAADFVTGSVGSETSGSIIYPTSQNSVFGLKPSLGLVSRDRIIPISDAMDTAGPIARSMTDLALLFNALVGVDSNDPLTEQGASLAGMDFTRFLQPDGLKGMRAGLIRKQFRASESGGKILDTAAIIMRDCGAEVMELEPELPEIHYLPVLDYGLKEGVGAYLTATGSRLSSLEQVITFNRDDLPNRAPFGQDLLEGAWNTPVTAERYREMVTANRMSGTAALKALLDGYHLDFLLTISNSLAGTYAPAGFPALCVPGGYRKDGEPVGLTLIGNYLADGTLIRAGYAFEQAARLRKTPVLNR